MEKNRNAKSKKEDRKKSEESIFKSNNLAEIRENIRELYLGKWEELRNKFTLKSKRQEHIPSASIGVFGNISQKDVNERALCFTLGTEPKRIPTKQEPHKIKGFMKPIEQLLLNELEFMSINYQWDKKSFLRHAAKQDGIFYGRAKEVKPEDNKKGGSGLIYEVWDAEKIIGEKLDSDSPIDLTFWLPKRMEEERDPEAKKAQKHVLVIGEDLTKLGVWREPCAVCVVIAIGIGEERVAGEERPADQDLKELFKMVYFLRNSAIMLTTYCFWEASSRPLEKLTESTKIQIIEELIGKENGKKQEREKPEEQEEKLKETSETRLFKIVWDLEDRFSKRQILRKLSMKDNKYSEDFNRYVSKNSGSVEYLKYLSACQKFNDSPYPISNAIDEISDYKKQKGKRPFWILGDIFTQANVNQLDEIVTSLDKLRLIVSDGGISELETYYLWLVGLSLLLTYRVELNSNNIVRRNIIDFMNACLNKFSNRNEWFSHINDICIRVDVLLHHSDLKTDFEEHCIKISPKMLKGINGFRKNIERDLFSAEIIFDPKCYFVLSQKGGVGKSIVAANICAALANKNNGEREKIALLEMDFSGPTYGYLKDISKKYWEWKRTDKGRKVEEQGFYYNYIDKVHGDEVDYPEPDPLNIKLKNGSSIDIFVAPPDISAQLASSSREELGSVTGFARQINEFINKYGDDYSHFVIDTPAEVRWMTEAALMVAKARQSKILFVGSMDLHSYTTFPIFASIVDPSAMKTAFLFNGIRKLDAIYFNDPSSFIDNLISSISEYEPRDFPNTNIMCLVEAFTQIRKDPDKKNNLFHIPWYHDLNPLEHFNGIIKYKHDSPDDPWMKITKWLKEG